MKKSFLMFLVLILSISMLTACSEQGSNDEDNVRVGVIFTQAGLGGNSFNDVVYHGVLRAQEDLGIEFDYVEPNSVSDAEIVQDEMAASEDYDLIITVGFEQVDALQKVAAKYPDQKFAIIDAEIDLPNVVSYLSKEEEASFLIGALSAYAKNEGASDKFNDGKTIGFIGGVDSPQIRKFAAGYIAGAKYVDEEYEILIDYVGSFNDPSTTKVIANTFNDKGADLIYHVAGASGMGLFQAAEEGDFVAIGVNFNQNSLAPDHIMASMLKKVDEAAYKVIQSVIDGTFEGGKIHLGLAEGGVDYTVEDSNIQVSEEIIQKVDELKDKVISGEIDVPETIEEVEEFLSNNR